MIDVNIFLAFTTEDNNLKELAAKKIETWNKTHRSLGYTFHPYDWLTDATPETRAEPRDGQFFINKQVIDKCELLFAFIINGTGTPGDYDGKHYPCATLYEVDYHRNNGRRACIFLNKDTPREEHFQFIKKEGMGLFWSGDKNKFRRMIYEKIDQVLMQYVEGSIRLNPTAKKIILSAYKHGTSFWAVAIQDVDMMYFLDTKEHKPFFRCQIAEGTEALECLREDSLIGNLTLSISENYFKQILRNIGLIHLKLFYDMQGLPIGVGYGAHRITKVGRRYCEKHSYK